MMGSPAMRTVSVYRWTVHLLALLLCAPAVAWAQGMMSAGEQNALVLRHCATCHSDAARNGGLSLEHFDAATVPPSLAAIMLSKITSGLALQTVHAAPSNSAAKGLVAKGMTQGAMLAAGVAPPANAVTYALIEALGGSSRDAHVWRPAPEGASSTERGPFTVSILREVARPDDGQGAMYRLIVSCDEQVRKGEMRLSWSPIPAETTVVAVADAREPVSFVVRGREKMGNGSPAAPTPPASVLLHGPNASHQLPLPARTLRVTGLFGDEVQFPFDALPSSARRRLAACFTQ